MVATSYGARGRGRGRSARSGVIGPTRMNYSKVITLVDFTAQLVSRRHRQTLTAGLRSEATMGNDDQKQGNEPESAGQRSAAAERSRRQPSGSSAPTLEQQLEQLEAGEQATSCTIACCAPPPTSRTSRSARRRRSDDAATRGREQLLKEILPALDNLERALKHAPRERSARRRRAAMVEKQLLAGAREVRRHALLGGGQAVRSVAARRHPAGRDQPSMPPGTVAQEFASGYMLGAAPAAAGDGRRWPRRRPATASLRSDDRRSDRSRWRASSASTSAPPTRASPSSTATSRW